MTHGQLRERIREYGYTQRRVAEILRMPEETLSRKLAGARAFTWQEILAICKILDISNPIGWFE